RVEAGHRRGEHAEEVRGGLLASHRATHDDVPPRVREQQTIQGARPCRVAEEDARRAQVAQVDEPEQVLRQIGEVVRGQALEVAYDLLPLAELALDERQDAAPAERRRGLL